MSASLSVAASGATEGDRVSHEQIVSVLPGIGGINDGHPTAAMDVAVREMVAALGISEDEARQRVEWNATFTAELSALAIRAPGTIAYSEVDSAARTATVHVTPEGADAVVFSDEIAEGIVVDATAVLSDHAAGELKIQLVEALESAEVEGSIDIDPVTEIVSVGTPEAPEAALSIVLPLVEGQLEVEVVDYVAAPEPADEALPPLAGAKFAPSLSNTGCGTSFTVQINSSADRGLITAEHCADNGWLRVYNDDGRSNAHTDVALERPGEDNKHGDHAVLDVHDPFVSDNVFVGPSLNSTELDHVDPLGMAQTSVGDWVCITGNRTIRADGGQARCDHVDGVNGTCWTSSTQCNRAWVGANITRSGDSGSPWWSPYFSRLFQHGTHEGDPNNRSTFTRLDGTMLRLPAHLNLYYD